MNIVNVTDENFEEEVLKSDIPVLVDYWAEWCGPCKMLSPILESIANDFDGQVKICKMDVDANSETPQKYGVRGIPTLMIFKNKDRIATKVGALSKAQLDEFVNTSI